jgi:hypothetical protein
MTQSRHNSLRFTKICDEVGRPDGKRPFARPRWEDNIKMDLEGVGWGGMNSIALVHDKDTWWVFVNAIMKLRVSTKCGEFLD